MKPSLELLEVRLAPASAVLDVAGNLVVTGTESYDRISVNTALPRNVTVSINGRSFGGFDLSAPGVRVIVYGLGNNDNIQVPGYLPAEVHGGGGDDVISGGSAADVLYGDEGNDQLIGNAGNDVLIGGGGYDRLTGNTGNDILASDDTTLTYDDLVAARDAWLAGTPGALDSLVLSMIPDGITDDLSGSQGQDAFVYRPGVDRVRDFAPGDQLYPF